MRLNSGDSATSAKLALLVLMTQSDTIFAGRHQPLCTWIGCLYLIKLNLSNHQIGQELDLNKDDIQKMTAQLRTGIVVKKPRVHLTGEVECDEMYLIAGQTRSTGSGQIQGPKRTSSPSESKTGTRHSGQRKAAHFWDDSAWRGGRPPNAGAMSSKQLLHRQLSHQSILVP